ncbi:hypothetical protein L7F22_060680 [Adiantum nelumboides]|nr:hypothetical protein [Adiantum nelumboides]
MAVTGFDFLTPTIKQHNYDPAPSILMDKQFFDLNKHALDLNEVPSNELGLDLREASCSHELGSSLHPRRGGWLELFRNMFEHDKVMSDSAPFASCTTMLNSRYINHMPQADGILRCRDPRLLSSHCSQVDKKSHNGYVVNQDRDAAMDRIAKANNLASIPDKHRKNGKSVASEEFNLTNVYASAPLFNHATIGGSHVTKPSINASGQPGCATDVLPSFFSSPEGLKPREWDRKGPQHLSGLYPKVDEASVGSSISYGFDQYKDSAPTWDLTSQPFPQWAADFEPLRHAKSSCITSSGLFSQMQVMDKIATGSPSAQVSEFMSMEENNDSGTLTIFLEKDKGSDCPSKKGSCRSDQENVMGLMNLENAPPSLSLSEDKEKSTDPRVRIIASPDWLPAGWITEVKTRMAGSTAGTTDKYYKDPVTGRRFRSKNEVLSFLQTGRLCRNKHQLNSIEGFAVSSSVQDLSLVPLDTSPAFVAGTTYLTSASDFSCQASIYQSLYPANAIPERPKVNKEKMNVASVLSASSDVCRASDLSAQLQASGSCTVQEIAHLETTNVGKPYTAIRPKFSNACMYNETVHKRKRKVAEDPLSLLSPKRLRSTFNDLQGKDKWVFCMEQISKDAERNRFATGVDCDLKTAQTSYPGLLNRLESNGAHDKAVNDFLTARYKANLKALGLYDASMIRNASEVNLGCVKELQPRTASVIKVVEKKSLKMILKEERDLLVTLGRKLCVEFLASAKG